MNSALLSEFPFNMRQIFLFRIKTVDNTVFKPKRHSTYGTLHADFATSFPVIEMCTNQIFLFFTIGGHTVLMKNGLSMLSNVIYLHNWRLKNFDVQNFIDKVKDYDVNTLVSFSIFLYICEPFHFLFFFIWDHIYLYIEVKYKVLNISRCIRCIFLQKGKGKAEQADKIVCCLWIQFSIEYTSKALVITLSFWLYRRRRSRSGKPIIEMMKYGNRRLWSNHGNR